MSNQGKLLLSFATVQFSTLRGRKWNSLALDEGGFEISISRDFGFKHPMAKILTSRASAEHVAFIEDQLLVTTLIRIQPQLKDIIKSSHVLSPISFQTYVWRRRLRTLSALRFPAFSSA